MLLTALLAALLPRALWSHPWKRCCCLIANMWTSSPLPPPVLGCGAEVERMVRFHPSSPGEGAQPSRQNARGFQQLPCGLGTKLAAKGTPPGQMQEGWHPMAGLRAAISVGYEPPEPSLLIRSLLYPLLSPLPQVWELLEGFPFRMDICSFSALLTVSRMG